MFEEQLVGVIVWLLTPATVLISSVGAGLALHTIGRTLPEDEEELVASQPQVEPGAKTCNTAAKAAGFSSTTEYRRAKTVVERGVGRGARRAMTLELPLRVSIEAGSGPVRSGTR